jgi:hypothetical protein
MLLVENVNNSVPLSNKTERLQNCMIKNSLFQDDKLKFTYYKLKLTSLSQKKKYYKAQTKIYFSPKAFWLSKYQQQGKA